MLGNYILFLELFSELSEEEQALIIEEMLSSINGQQ